MGVDSMMDYKKYFQEKFNIAEIVPPAVYHVLGDAAWNLFDENLLLGAGWMRNQFGPAVCNNWKKGGAYEWSGLRMPESPVYSATSQHSVSKDHLCCALDLKFSNHTAEEVRNELRLMEVPFITRIEDNVNWIHIDVKPTGLTELYFFKP